MVRCIINNVSNAAPALANGPEAWVEDVTWHRRMFRESKFRWAPEDPMRIALTWTRGRVVHETPGDLKRLDEQLMGLRDYASHIDDAMVARLEEAKHRCTRADYEAGLGLIGLTQLDVDILQFHARRQPTPNRAVKRALSGIPWPNPFSQVWELRQMRSMYTAADNLLEDAALDLAVELAPTHGWDYLAQLMRSAHSGKNLQWLVDEQRRERGEPGDPRRSPEQRY